MIKFSKRPRSLFGKLMFSHLIVVALSIIAVGVFLSYQIENYFITNREWEITGLAQDAAYLIGEDMEENDMEAVEKTAETLAYSLNAKIRVLDANHIIIYTIDPDQDETDQVQEEGVSLEEREIEQVFQGNMFTKKIYGPVLQRLLVATPIFEDEPGHNIEGESSNETEESRVVGAVTVSMPFRGIEETLAYISQLILYSGGIGVVIAAILAFSLSKKLIRPLHKINRAALDMAAGNFKSKIEEESDDEIGGVIKTFNYSVEQVEKYLEEQKRLEVLRRNLVANVSHELKAPLSSVRGFSELMLDDYIDEEQKKKYLKVIQDNSVHLSRLVDDLLTLSHLESGQLSLEKQEIAVADLANWSFDSVSPRGDAKGVELKFDLPSSLPMLYGDRHRLHEVLVNLLNNAIEYTPSGGQVLFEVKYDEAQVIFEIKDTGYGISEEDLPYIFERFYKADKSRRRSSQGSGLGLAITRHLVELHGGSIEVESEEGQGSVFRVILPT
ncbi:MAG: ATP-binding protein [Bacillota bacterium]